MTNPVFDTSARGRSSRVLTSAARAELDERSRVALERNERSYERFNVNLSARCAHMSARALLVLLLPLTNFPPFHQILKDNSLVLTQTAPNFHVRLAKSNFEPRQ